MATRTKTYAQLAREIQALQASADKVRALEVQSAIANINRSIALYGLTAEDLRFEGVRSASSPGAAADSGRQRAKVSASSGASATKTSDAKFSDGKGQVWSGRGPRPIWLRNALLQGRTLESFAVSASNSGSASDTSPATGTAARSAAAKPANKLPARFQHAKTGKTWSGRGPQPAWLKQGLKKRGATLDDFRVAESESSSGGMQTPETPVSEASKSPVAATKKKVAAAGKKPAAKKVPAAKKTTAAATASPVAPAPVRKAVTGKVTAKKSAAPAKKTPSPALNNPSATAVATAHGPAGIPAAKKTAAAKSSAATDKASLAEKIASSAKTAVDATPAKKAKAKPSGIDATSASNQSPTPETPAGKSAAATPETPKPVKTWDF